jgi:hypothetical protein
MLGRVCFSLHFSARATVLLRSVALHALLCVNCSTLHCVVFRRKQQRCDVELHGSVLRWSVFRLASEITQPRNLKLGAQRDSAEGFRSLQACRQRVSSLRSERLFVERWRYFDDLLHARQMQLLSVRSLKQMRFRKLHRALSKTSQNAKH